MLQTSLARSSTSAADCAHAVMTHPKMLPGARRLSNAALLRCNRSSGAARCGRRCWRLSPRSVLAPPPTPRRQTAASALHPWRYMSHVQTAAGCSASCYTCTATQAVKLASPHRIAVDVKSAPATVSLCLAAGRAGGGRGVCSCFQPAAQLPAGRPRQLLQGML